MGLYCGVRRSLRGAGKGRKEEGGSGSAGAWGLALGWLVGAATVTSISAMSGVELGKRQLVLRQALVMDCARFSNESFI